MKNKLLDWGEMLGGIIIAVGIFTLLVSLYQDITSSRERSANTAEQLSTLESRLDASAVNSVFFEDEIVLSYEDGGWKVRSNGRLLQPFKGAYRVCLRDLITGRHHWTCEWTDWIDYEGTPGILRYRQPEDLDWWANIPKELASQIPPSSAKLMTTCRKILVDGVGTLPKCIESIWTPQEGAIQ